MIHRRNGTAPDDLFAPTLIQYDSIINEKLSIHTDRDSDMKRFPS